MMPVAAEPLHQAQQLSKHLAFVLQRAIQVQDIMSMGAEVWLSLRKH